MDITPVKPVQLKKLLIKCAQKQRAAMIWGSPGIGKSEIVAEIGKTLNRPIIDLRLVLMDPTDLKGIPYYHPTKNKMVWAFSEELPTNEYFPNAIILYDEINSAPPSVQASAYQFILDRRCGSYVLPNDVIQFAAGNLESDRGATNRMPTPLLNRFVHFGLGVSFDEWKSWAVSNNHHPDIIAYLSSRQGNLFNFDPKRNDKAFATPRSWSFFNQFYDGELDSDDLVPLMAGTVGEGIALEFKAFLEICIDIPDPKLIISGKLKEYKTNKLDIIYSIISNVVCYLKQNVKKEELITYFDTVITFCQKNFEDEIVIYTVSSFLNDLGLPKKDIVEKSKIYDKFLEKFGKYLLDDNYK